MTHNQTSTTWTEEDQQATEPDFYSKWISVESELPPAGTWVIGATSIDTIDGRHERIAKELFFDGVNEYGTHWLCDGDWDGSVTDWMILPTPPTERAVKS